ncbi:Gfo/Idh/MocA family protein [Roseobacter weihaiensis]|uniref:Gfo/Idh/MocA family protein n=1 Tax=Roseobacter weihaiensis TaxID=2763262 RepID=UPI001D0AE604|nr:Gfo/Idh/MocA family oxidoreductase [Roseobacter sp. H9]
MKRILVVGGGLIGARHVEAIKAHAGCRLVGLVDPDPAVLPGADLNRYADMAEVTETVDGVILATPTQLHAPQGIYAASRGWHMLIEKPVASDRAAATALKGAVARAGVRALVGHHRRHHASVWQLKALISEGKIGTPVVASLIWAMRKPDAYFDGNWRTADGSPVLINLVHDIDLLRFVLGEIVTTRALRGAGLRGEARVESGAIALAFESGATGTISFADTTPSPWGFEAGTGENPHIGTTHQDMMWITGTDGAVSFPSMTLWSGTDWGTPAQRHPAPRAENTKPPLAAQLDHFLEVIDGANPIIDVADATRTLAVALQIDADLTAETNGGTYARSALA